VQENNRNLTSQFITGFQQLIGGNREGKKSQDYSRLYLLMNPVIWLEQARLQDFDELE
jgi:hypothetical protein